MKMTIYVALLFIYQFALGQAVVPTIDAVADAKEKIETLIDSEDALDADGLNKLIGGFVRLNFHDCVGNGGCDGCIDHTNADNGGLKAITDVLDASYVDFATTQMSRADFYALAGIVALESATEVTTDKFTGGDSFVGGREDCTTSPNEDQTDEDLPSSNIEYGAIEQYFNDHFGFTMRQTIALLGAHTLGRARLANSGYDGPWTVTGGNTGPNVLDNRYYHEIVNVPWTQEQLSSGNNHWINPPATNMLLNSDAALSLTLSLNDAGEANCVMCARRGGRPGATVPCCAQNAGDATCVSFAADNALWLTEFTDVFLQMINKNPATLAPPGAQVTTPAPETTTTAAPPTTTPPPPPTTTTTTTPPPTTTTTTEAPVNPPVVPPVNPPPRPNPGPGPGPGPGPRPRPRPRGRPGRMDVEVLINELETVKREVEELKEKLED